MAALAFFGATIGYADDEAPAITDQQTTADGAQAASAPAEMDQSDASDQAPAITNEQSASDADAASAPPESDQSDADVALPDDALREFAFSVSVPFEAGAAELSSQARTILDQVRQQLTGTVDGALRVTGHSDPVESSLGRDDLAEARARAVGTYLANVGVPQQSIEVRSVGSSNQADDSIECLNQNALELVDCLAPDRAVDVEVVASKFAPADRDSGSSPDSAANPDETTPTTN
jgi:OOP family OmpA-OmpF porin